MITFGPSIPCLIHQKLLVTSALCYHGVQHTTSRDIAKRLSVDPKPDQKSTRSVPGCDVQDMC